MGQLELSGVAQALAAAHERRMQNAQMQALASFRQTQQELEEKQREIENRRIDEEHARNEQLAKTAIEVSKLNTFKEKENLQRRIEDSNSLPPGAQFINGGSFEKGGQIQLPQEFNDQDTGEPSITQIDPIAVRAKRLADYNALINKPIMDEAARKQKEAEDARADNIRAQMQEKAEAAKQHNETMQTIAQIAAAMKQGNNTQVDPAELAEQVHSLLTGDITKEDAKKLYSGKMAPVYTSVLNAASKVGTPISATQKKILDDAQARLRNLDEMDGAINELPNTTNKISAFVKGLGPALSPKFQQHVDQLKSNLAADTRVNSGLNRIAMPEVNLDAPSFIPSATTPKSVAIANRDAYLNKIKATIHSIAKNPEQENLLLQRYGINNYRPYGDQQLHSDTLDKINALMPRSAATSAPTTVVPTVSGGSQQ